MRPRSVIVALFAVLATLVAGLFVFRERTANTPAQLFPLPTHRAVVPSLVTALRPIYPYSVIPGGAYSKAELEERLMRDPLVQLHYRDFHVGETQLLTLDRTIYAYVSYRKGDRIWWTQKPLQIPAGELLLTDGRAWARARCGNRLSPQKQQVLSDTREDPMDALSLPALTPESLKDRRITFAQTDASGAAPLLLQPNWTSLFLPIVPPLPPVQTGQVSATPGVLFGSTPMSGLGVERVGPSASNEGTPVVTQAGGEQHPPSIPEPGDVSLAVLGLSALGLYFVLRAGGTPPQR